LSFVKTKERVEARRLRRLGWSVREIERRLGVSRSSVSLWVRDVPLTEEQIAELHRRSATSPGQLAGAAANAALGRVRRRSYQTEGRNRAREGDRLHLAGCMLFWAEGDKHRNGVRLTNSDPDLLRLFVTFLRRSYDADPSRIAVTCNLFADHLARQREIEDFWLRTLDLPRFCLRKSIVNVYSKYSQKKRRNKLPYGTCKVAYSDTAVAQSIYGAIQEYAGFERPEWLG
jgi:transcriptional regulator with XRE-family HTH domain